MDSGSDTAGVAQLRLVVEAHDFEAVGHTPMQRNGR